MKQFLLLIVFLVGLCLVLVISQISAQEPITITPALKDKILTPTVNNATGRNDSVWVFEENFCGVSCWRNIIPGVTTSSELTSDLHLDDMVTSISDVSDLGFIEWEYEHGVWVRANLYRDLVGLPVSDLTINMPRYGTLQEVISYIGEPSHIAIVADTSPDMTSTKPTILYRIYFIYSGQGIVLHYLRTQAPSQANITKTSLIDQVIIVESNTDNFMTHLRIHDSNSLLTWQGDNTLIYYCNLAYTNSEFCP